MINMTKDQYLKIFTDRIEKAEKDNKSKDEIRELIDQLVGGIEGLLFMDLIDDLEFMDLMQMTLKIRQKYNLYSCVKNSENFYTKKI